MILVKNKLRQPLTVNIPGKEAIHFLAKQKKELTEFEYNAPEMKRHVDLGNIVLLKVANMVNSEVEGSE